MEVEADPNLLVVNLEHCVSSETRHLGKSSCIYTTTMPPNSCHDVLQLATPVQCIGDLNQPLSRIPHQHLTQLQPLQYPQVQVSYENGALQQSNGALLPGGAPLYQAAPPQTTLHHYHPPPPPPPPPPQAFHGSYLTPLSVTPSGSLQEYSPLIPSSPQQGLQDGLASQTPETSSSHMVSSAPTHSSPIKKVDVAEPEPPPADDYQYYKEIESLLVTNEVPPNSSSLYNKRLRKRAQNYVMVDGVLHHNPKSPRRVIMTKDEQVSLLESFHVTPSTGVHVGIKKMFAKLRDECFWRGMYVGVATYVRKCTRCSDSSISLMPHVNANIQQESPPVQNGISVGLQTSSKIWNDVEIQLCGPYNVTNNRNSYIAVVVDPHSKFLLAAALPSSGLATRLTQFILSSLFSFGFTRSHLVTTIELYSAVLEEFSRRTRDLRDCHGLLRRRDTPCCDWVTSLFTFLVDKKPSRWDRELDKFLYQFRSGEMKQLANICANSKESVGAVCPFYAMFQRSPCPLSAAAVAENKENSFPISSRKAGANKIKRIHKSLQCSQSGNIVSKKLPDSEQKSFVTAGALKARSPDGCPPSDNGMPKRVDGNEIIKQMNNGDITTNGDVEPVRMAVCSIKAFLAETRVKRQRRGSYNKYPDELRDRMACYALKHGSQEAAKHFSTVLGTQVNDSTIRNLLKSRARFGPALRQEIAKFATENGVSEAAKYFSGSLNMNVSHCLVRRFKSLYGPKRHNKKTRNKMKKDIEGLTLKVKDDIGSYANEHTTVETINHFKLLLGIDLLESAVKKLHQDYLKKQPLKEQSLQEQRLVKQESIPEYNVQHNVCFSQSVSGVSQNTYYNSIQLCQPPYSAQCPERPPESIEIETGVVSQPFLLISQEPHSNYELGVQEKRDDKNNWENTNNSNANDYQQYPPVDNHIFVQVIPEKNNTTIQSQDPEPVVSSPKQDLKQPKKSKKKITGVKKRGKYCTFSPEVRAEIGKYAAEHGCLKASHHFSNILGHDLPESTARGIKEKYLRKVRYSEVTSLGYSPRGRVPRLGKYDEMVQDCLKELIKTGERASAFLAIITAKKVLNKYEPNLLKENGGTIELNNSWAKSFLKRLGLRNNS